MAQFFGLMSLNAENFESDDASDGEVLTADGAGGAAWEAAAGGGGAAFLWDTVDYTVGAIEGGGESPLYRTVTFTLKLGSVAITEDTIITVALMGTSDNLITPDIGGSLTYADTYFAHNVYLHASAPRSLSPNSYGDDVYLVFFKPDGSIVKILIDVTA